MPDKKKQGKKKAPLVKAFPIPFALNEIKDNISISTNTFIKVSKDQIINQALKFYLEGNISEAARYYQYLVDQGFNDHKLFYNYGIILKDLGKLEEAEESLRKSIQLNANYADTHSNLGNILRNLGKLREAELSQRKAIELNPELANAHSNLGNIFRDLGKLKEAELSTRKAIELNPEFVEAYSNLGFILINLGKLQEAESLQLKAIELNPQHAEAHSNLAYIQLLNGDYGSGLENYEFRFKMKEPVFIHGQTRLKRIDSEKIQRGEKLIVVSEQGLGDTFLFMRYVPFLRKLGLDVSFSAQKKLHTLIKSSGIEKKPLTPDQVNEVTEGKWIPLLSLPRYLKIRPENPIISEPYISSTDQLTKKWKNILSTEKRPIVAINWQGNPNMEKRSYQGRSIPLEQFSYLTNNNEIKLLSLQKGFGSEQLDHCSFRKKFVQCQPQIDSTWDFLENAAIIENCDLVITCDTSIAHLAGGIGKKVWLLLKDIPYWTWGLKGESTFWYPSMRLFRQKERQNWQEVMQRVSNELKIELLKKI